jgi:hypothetical protein
VRCQRLDGAAPAEPFPPSLPMLDGLKPPLSESQLELFRNEAPEWRLVTASPAIVTNANQKTGKFQLQFKAPALPGKYRFVLVIKSQDFIGADQEVRVDVVVVDASKVERSPKAMDELQTTEEPKKDR